jgi:predicted NAD/FAD-dependent oxidoreductase
MKHCPECNVEYMDTAGRCSDCDVELALGPAIQEEHPDPKIETVYATGDPALVAMAKSLLEDAEIEYFTKGDEIQDLIGWGRLGGENNAIGPVEFVVAAEDAPKARELLDHLDDAVPDELREEEPGT